MNNISSSRVLVVDDDPSVLAVMRRTVEGLGFSAECAASRAEARERLRGEPFDALISDVAMESKDAGVRLAEEAQTLKAGMPVILVSGDPSSKELFSTFGAGDCAYLPKPFRVGDLASMVKRALTSEPLPAEARQGMERLEDSIAQARERLVVTHPIGARPVYLATIFRAQIWDAAERGQYVTYSITGTSHPVLMDGQLVTRAVSQLLAGAIFAAGEGGRLHADLKFGSSEVVLSVFSEGDSGGRSWDMDPRLVIAKGIFEGQGGFVRILGGAFTVTLPLATA